MHTPVDAPATEQTPLLSSSNRPNAPPAGDFSSKRQTPISWTYHAMTLAFVFLSLLLCLLVTIVFTAHSYVAPLLQTDPSLLAQRSVVFEGPSHFNILNYTSEGLWCELAGAATIDGARTLGLSSNRITDKLVGWAVRQVGSVTVSTSGIQIFSDDDVHLASLDLPSIVLPLSTENPPPLANITVQLLLRPARDVQHIIDFASHSWQNGSAGLRVSAAKGVIVGGGRASTWRNRVHVEKHNIQSVFNITIPPIPGLPPPPPNEPRPIPDLASLVYLQSYRVLPPPPTLRLVGAATFPNPLPSVLQGAIALSLPFVVSLPSMGSGASLPVARVETAPLALTTPNISLAITGHILPLPSSSNSIAPVSKFASDFLAARQSPVLITTDFLRDLGMAEELTVQSEFPAPAEKPDILRDVQISNMRIALRGEQIFASAFVRAHIVPPNTLAAIRVNATRVWPDLLVYDGPAPDFSPFEDPNSGTHSGTQYDELWSEPDPMPLPRPLPPTAFARIRPDSWIIAHTEFNDKYDGGEENSGVWVHAQVTDVPLDVLPGRDAELRGFIRKVLFNTGGARAGVSGITAVAARVGGLVVGSRESGELEMFGLPLRGETRVGKKNLHEPGWGLPLPSSPLTVPSVPSVPTNFPSFPSPTLPHVPELPSQTISAPDPDPLDDDDWPVFSGGGAGSAQESYSEQNSEELWQVGVAY